MKVLVLVFCAFQVAYGANIAEVATQAGFTTLVDLVVKAGLADTLSNGGPFTVFAPTNAAFAKLPQSTLNALGQDTELLKSVLLYHVVSGTVKSGDLSDELVANSVQGSPLRFNKYQADSCNSRVGRSAEPGWGHSSYSRPRSSAVRNARSAPFFTVNGKKIVQADVAADNGVIHVVDTVIFPLADKTLVEVLQSKPEFSTLVAAVQAAGLVDTLNSAGPFTVFAPTNAAFNKIPQATLQSLLGDKPALTKILLRHVVPDTIFAAGIPCSVNVKSAGGDNLAVRKSGRNVSVTSTANGVRTRANVVAADVIGSNGVAHAINMVI